MFSSKYFFPHSGATTIAESIPSPPKEGSSKSNMPSKPSKYWLSHTARLICNRNQVLGGRSFGSGTQTKLNFNCSVVNREDLRNRLPYLLRCEWSNNWCSNPNIARKSRGPESSLYLPWAHYCESLDADHIRFGTQLWRRRPFLQKEANVSALRSRPPHCRSRWAGTVHLPDWPFRDNDRIQSQRYWSRLRRYSVNTQLKI